MVRATCKAYGMEFAMIDSLNEFNEVYSGVQRNPTLVFNLHFFVDGMTLSSKSKTDWYFSVTGKKFPYTMPWTGGQPDNAGNNEKCLSMHPSPRSFNDLPCNMEAPFLCQKKICDHTGACVWLFLENCDKLALLYS